MTRSILGLGLVLAIAACAQLQTGGETASLASCGAEAHQDWVGQRIDVLNDVELPPGARVLFPTTPAGMDLNEERLNVSVDATDTISRVWCG
jgi:Peptidase inhibitor I78 family